MIFILSLPPRNRVLLSEVRIFRKHRRGAGILPRFSISASSIPSAPQRGKLWYFHTDTCRFGLIGRA